ncbi:ATP-binding protein [Rummeliibacillus stabekisii]|uniref:ATP-binding protein n=1 Tax=Rummeliibacillus stabekisii TaxID=241244 RepID=UPI00184BAEB9|nr:ATP-binding protein [Rummeliibacillus stabekisii]MBB5171231.1 two-component system sensor histidine kinase YcbA [Rummeliibacillus stabekisii]
MLLIAILTAVSSEIKLSPFQGEPFRFGVGSITFLVLLLARKPKSVLKTGIITGITVVLFRLIISVIFYSGTWDNSFQEHLPAFFYYFLYVLLFQFIKLEKFIDSPFKLGLIATGIEIVANTAEHMLRYLMSVTNIGISDLLLIVMVAFLRSFFVVGIFSSIIAMEEKKRVGEQLSLDSGLYVETLYLQKMMNHIEQIMADSYDFYRTLKADNQSNLSVRALHISQEIHEVKKDAQRIFSGLSDISLVKTNEEYYLSNIVEFVEKANFKYGGMLNKRVELKTTQTVDFILSQQNPILAILNNLVANAVEAIEDSGMISVSIWAEGNMIHFKVQDNGTGIKEEDMDIIFEPGFTTKYNQQGVAATGIGLSHVKEIINMLEGEIRLEDQADGTAFHIRIPKKNIEKRVEQR